MFKNYVMSMKVLVLGLAFFLGMSTLAFAQLADTTLNDLEFNEIATDTIAVPETAVSAPAGAAVDSLKNRRR